MNLYKISRDDVAGFDEFDSAVVVAESEEKARLIHPAEWAPKNWHENKEFNAIDCWIKPEKVFVALIGSAKEGLEEGMVIVSSFNAG